MTKDNFPNFFKWIFTKWYFWVIFILWGVWSGIEEIKAGYIPEFLGTLSASFIIVIIIFGIIYLINKSIHKRIKEEVKLASKK